MVTEGISNSVSFGAALQGAAEQHAGFHEQRQQPEHQRHARHAAPFLPLFPEDEPARGGAALRPLL